MLLTVTMPLIHRWIALPSLFSDSQTAVLIVMSLVLACGLVLAIRHGGRGSRRYAEESPALFTWGEMYREALAEAHVRSGWRRRLPGAPNSFEEARAAFERVQSIAWSTNGKQ